MSTDPTRISTEDLLRNKEMRRQALAAKTVEEKVDLLIKLQEMTSEIARQSGREYKKPWRPTKTI